MDHKDVVSYVRDVPRTTDVSFARKRLCFAWVANEMNMNIKLLEMCIRDSGNASPDVAIRSVGVAVSAHALPGIQPRAMLIASRSAARRLILCFNCIGFLLHEVNRIPERP